MINCPGVEVSPFPAFPFFPVRFVLKLNGFRTQDPILASIHFSASCCLPDCFAISAFKSLNEPSHCIAVADI
uniref:Expressed protein n=1 Tax=Echinococcus granulosus TaxID=6210 RepID=A0A068X451_ECHGR|nr:expressed protein [Echinococcus granulosus]